MGRKGDTEPKNVFTECRIYYKFFLGGENVGISYCHGLGGNQVFAYTKRQQIMSDDNCLDATGTDGIVKLIRCHGMGGNQAWLFEAQVLMSNIAKFFHRDYISEYFAEL